jgi:hypothetical protein
LRLSQIWLRSHAILALIAGVTSTVAGLAAGLPPATAVGLGLSLALLLMLLGGLRTLHAMGRGAKVARMSLGVDLMGAATFTQLLGSWIIPAVALRLFFLTRSARRRRWDG